MLRSPILLSILLSSLDYTAVAKHLPRAKGDYYWNHYTNQGLEGYTNSKVHYSVETARRECIGQGWQTHTLISFVVQIVPFSNRAIEYDSLCAGVTKEPKEKGLILKYSALAVFMGKARLDNNQGVRFLRVYFETELNLHLGSWG